VESNIAFDISVLGTRIAFSFIFQTTYLAFCRQTPDIIIIIIIIIIFIFYPR